MENIVVYSIGIGAIAYLCYIIWRGVNGSNGCSCSSSSGGSCCGDGSKSSCCGGTSKKLP